MSAVGLLLLEDPKARARAEAKLRNGTARKRGGLPWGNKNQAAGQPPTAARRQPNVPPAIPDEDSPDESPIVRPSTSLSSTIALPHRKKNDSSSDRSSSRSSTLFGRKNSVTETSSIKSGSSGRASQFSTAVSTAVSSNYSRDQPSQMSTHGSSNHSHDRAGYGEDYRAPTRNVAGLPPAPWGQRKVKQPKPIPELDAYEDRDMQAQYWASSQQTKPKVQLNGVQTEDWATAKLEPESETDSALPSPALPAIDPNPPRLPNAARMSFFDDSIFNGVKDAPPLPEDRAQPPEGHRKSTRDGRMYSTMVARNSLMFPEEPILQTPGATARDNPMDAVPDLPNGGKISPSAYKAQETKTKPSRGNAFATQYSHIPPTAKYSTVPPPAKYSTVPPPAKYSTMPPPPPPPPKSKLPSLPVPEHKPSSKSSASSLGSASHNSGSNSRLDLPVEKTIASDVTSVSRSSSSTRKSPALTFTSNVRESTVFNDNAWEDDIDFAYAEEAEANCDYDWDDTNRSNSVSYQSAGGDAYYTRPGSRPSSSNYGDETRHDARDSLLGGSTPNAERPVSERRESQTSNGPVRSSFVGHRGFAAARNSNGDKLAKPSKASKLPPLAVPQSSSKSGNHSSESDSGDETERSPDTPDDIEFPMPPGSADALKFPLPPGSPNPVGFPAPPSGHRISESNSSDRDSCYSGSRHRKSSSYGSYESLKRASTAPSTAPSSVPSARDTGRWSMASASSIPSIPTLIPSKHKRASSLTKTTISTPLETLSQGPEEEKLTQMVNNRFSPHTLQVDPERDSFVMRRPRTSGDRRLLQAAGRAVQRYRPERPTTPNSHGRNHEAFSGPMGSTNSVPAWI